MATHSSTLAWKIPWTEELVGCCLWGRIESDTIERLHFHFSLFMHWRRKWQPTPDSCLENPREGGAWWAAVYGVAQSRTRLKRLSSSSSSSKLLCPWDSPGKNMSTDMKSKQSNLIKTQPSSKLTSHWG